MLVIRLSYTSVPLRSNDRLHWRAKAVQVKAIREAAALAARDYRRHHKPIDYPVIVTLVWEVADKRVRDAGASAPTGKAAIDGLVDAGVLSSDRHQIVVEERYRVEIGHSRGVRLEIVPVEAPQDADLRPLEAPARHQRAIYGESGTTALRGAQAVKSTKGTK